MADEVAGLYVWGALDMGRHGDLGLAFVAGGRAFCLVQKASFAWCTSFFCKVAAVHGSGGLDVL